MACTAVHMYIDKLSVRLYSIVLDFIVSGSESQICFCITFTCSLWSRLIVT